MKKALLIMGLFTVMIFTSYARTVTGIVSDKSGNPLTGVTIVLKGTSTGVNSDANGNFTIQVPEDKYYPDIYLKRVYKAGSEGHRFRKVKRCDAGGSSSGRNPPAGE